MRQRKGTARRAAVHFVLIGSLLFAGDRWLEGRAPGEGAAPRSPITLSSARIEQLRTSFRRRAGTTPTTRSWK